MTDETKFYMIGQQCPAGEFYTSFILYPFYRIGLETPDGTYYDPLRRGCSDAKISWQMIAMVQQEGNA